MISHDGEKYLLKFTLSALIFARIMFRGLAFPAIYNPREILQDFPSAKFNICEISEKVSEKSKWIAKGR